MKKSIIAIVALLLFGCSSTPNLSMQAIEVSRENLGQYWETKSESFSFPSSKNAAKRPKGFVKVRYLIDSNGEVFNPQVVESVPMGVWDDEGLRAVEKLEYKPSIGNPSRNPVYVTTEFQFDVSV